jgi:ketosteroid isomerase-like protein
MNMATTRNAYSEVEARNLDLVRSGFDKWVQGSGSVFELLAATARSTIVGNSDVSRVYESKQELMESVIEPFNARLSRPLIPNLRGLYANQDLVVALFDGAAVAKDGKAYRNTYSWSMRLRDDRIVEVVAYFDSIAFNDFWRRIKP